MFAVGAPHGVTLPHFVRLFAAHIVGVLLFELCHHLQCSNSTLIAFVAKAAAAALLGLQEVVGGYEAENDGGVVLYIEL